MYMNMKRFASYVKKPKGGSYIAVRDLSKEKNSEGNTPK